MNFDHHHYDRAERTEDFNSKIMLIAIFSLCFVILLVIILHIYARYFLRHPRHNTASSFIYRDLTPQYAEPVSAQSGLEPTVINLIPSFQFKQMEGHDDDNIECAVCLSMLEEAELARRLPNCNHVFHMECIDKWFTSQSSCPICRSEASPRLDPLDREPPIGGAQLTEVVVVTSENEHEHQNDMQIVTNSTCNDCNNDSKITNGNGPSSSASFRMSSFRKIISRDRSSSFSRIRVSGEIDPRRQVQHYQQ